MSDEADLANDAVERFTTTAQTYRKHTGPDPIGVCYNCGDPVSEGMRWCDTDCREDWGKRAVS
jgi:hypothetical protein